MHRQEDMERYEAQSGNVAILPQGEFVELASVIEVVDATDQDIIWNQHDDIDGEYEFTTLESVQTEEKEMNNTKTIDGTDSRWAYFAPHKEIGFFNAGFIVLLTLIIYPIIMVGANIWNSANEFPLFRATIKLVTSIVRS